MTNTDRLEDLYHATEEDMQFAVGLLALTGPEPIPIIQIRYRDWSREKLEVVRDSFVDGLILVSGQRMTGTQDLYIATQQTITLQAGQDKHTSVLRGPAWNAHLPNIDAAVVHEFDVNRRRYGGFLLLVQTPEWEFLTAVDNKDQTIVGAILPQSMASPATAL